MSQRFDIGDLEGAREAGIIDQATINQLVQFMQDKGDPGASSDNENLRFLANFNDVFLSVGLVLLSFGLIVGSSMLFASTGSALIVGLPVVATLWGLMEYFAGRRRLLLPSMVLSFMLTWIVSLLVALTASGLMGASFDSASFIGDGIDAVESFGIWAAIGGLVSSAAIFARFRLPFSFFLMALAGASLIYFLFAQLIGDIGSIIGAMLILLTGFATLAVACGFDMRDPRRLSLSSDNGFWLNFAAAPQIIFGVGLLLENLGMPLSQSQGAILFIAALIPLAFLSLALNRRALIAASLISFWIAVTTIVGETGAGNGTAEVVVALLLTGGGVVLLSSGWKTARRMVLALLPKSGSAGRLFPPEPA